MGRTVGCLPPLGACLASSGTMKVSFREKAFESVQTQVPLSLYLKYILSFVVVSRLYLVGQIKRAQETLKQYKLPQLPLAAF